ncbi:prohead protease/major capsid protein fusion protein [Hyphomicrobium sp.]|uniref:prohead protease/major capsid protein fusion protein n=1 Tax=Hyphomicrobium sp. TaxID=82 RepID=UPI002FDF7531
MPVATIEPEAMLTRLAPSSGASSWDAKARTFRAVIAAGAGVQRWDRDGLFTEYLDPAGIELRERVPVLNAHRQHDIADVLGTVVKVERKGDRIEALLRMSKRAEVEAVVADIADGVLSGVSVGYQVLAWREEEDDAGNRTKTAIRWRLLEVSVVPVPADDGAHFRSKNMPTTPSTDDDTTIERDERAQRAEDRRRATIYDLGTRHHAADFAAQHVEAGTSVADFRAALIDRVAERAAQQPQTISMIGADAGHVSLENPEHRREAMAEAIAVRANPNMTPSPAARQFMGMSLTDLARACLQYAGADTRGMGRDQIVARALGRRSMGGMHTTSDFSLVLGSAVGRTLRAAYEAVPSGLKPLARRLELSDFRKRTMISLSGFSALEKVNEHGEFKRGSLKDTGESVGLDTFGRMFAISRQAIVNDDLGAFDDLPRRLGIAAANFEAEQLASVLAANPVMSDGTQLFHANHGNLAAAGGAIATATVSAGRLAMRRQTDEAGQLIGVAPTTLVVGPALETAAEQFLAAINPTATTDAQPIRLQLAVEPRIAGNAWHLAASPSQIDGLCFAHLEGAPGPQVFAEEGFDVDGVKIKIRLDFGCAWLDWRGWYRNAGAA